MRLYPLADERVAYLKIGRLDADANETRERTLHVTRVCVYVCLQMVSK